MPTIKVTDEEYERIMEARRQLAMQGIRTLPPAVQKQAQANDMDKFTMGAIVGIAALLLLDEINKNR